MKLQVHHASTIDLPEAEQLMRLVLRDDLGGYQPQWHSDLDDLAAAYVQGPRHGLFVARLAGRVVGTAAVKPCLLRTPPNPEWLARRYNTPAVCELVRVWIHCGARRQGVGRALVQEAACWAIEEAGYETVYLHMDTSAPGAEPFWRSLPTVQVHDARPGPFNCVHFEIDTAKLGRWQAAR